MPASHAPTHQLLGRRKFLADCGAGLSKAAAASLFAQQATASQRPADPKPPHFAPRAKAVIHLFMGGAPSQLDLFDPKPALTKYEGKPLPPSVIGDQRYAFILPDAAVLGPRFPFARHGDSGAQLSSPLKHLAGVADELCIVRSMHTDQFNHAPARRYGRAASCPSSTTRCGCATAKTQCST